MPDPSYHAPAAIEAAQAAQLSAESLSDALRISELRYRRLFETARDGILILDSEYGKITDANPFMSELLGYLHDELIGKELWEIGLLKNKQASQEAFELLKQEGYIRYEDLPLCNRNEQLRDVEVVSNLYRENGHNVIQCNIRDITARKRAETELVATAIKSGRIADTLQHSMLQSISSGECSGMMVETNYLAALNEAEIGGDFFDAFALSGERVALVVGDVSGKGLVAAARTAEVKYALRAFLHEYDNPETALARLNAFICATHRLDESGTEMFIVLALTVVNACGGEATFAMAGAEPTLVLRASGTVEQISGTGALLGIQAGATYTATTIPFAIGDTVLMSTDGITEARHGDTFLGVDGFAGLVKAAGPAMSLPNLREAIYLGALNFAGGGFRDDVCLLLARSPQ